MSGFSAFTAGFFAAGGAAGAIALAGIMIAEPPPVWERNQSNEQVTADMIPGTPPPTSGTCAPSSST